MYSEIPWKVQGLYRKDKRTVLKKSTWKVPANIKKNTWKNRESAEKSN